MRRLVLFSFYLIFQLIFCKNIFSQNVDHDSTYNLDSGLVEKWLRDEKKLKTDSAKKIALDDKYINSIKPDTNKVVISFNIREY